MKDFGQACTCVILFIIFALVINSIMTIDESIRMGDQCKQKANVSSCEMIYIPNTEVEIIERYKYEERNND